MIVFFPHYHLVPLSPLPSAVTTLLSMSMSPFSFLLNPSLPSNVSSPQLSSWESYYFSRKIQMLGNNTEQRYYCFCTENIMEEFLKMSCVTAQSQWWGKIIENSGNQFINKSISFTLVLHHRFFFVCFLLDFFPFRI